MLYCNCHRRTHAAGQKGPAVKTVMKTPKNVTTAAILITAFLLLVTAGCVLFLLAARKDSEACTAEIYQDGKRILSIPLDRVSETYTLDIRGKDGCVNRIEVRPGSIGVVYADCPDRLCVRQGFVSSPSVPVTCLPNRLVILLRSRGAADDAGPDAITY